ncbi:MAG: HpcH/HpaI aldolase/citrate lyase family protein [Magnetococcales bacterium]|nr:HpcH/HpaI aldolase/citrate lyase family protein [Magnetococcales bacterium]
MILSPLSLGASLYVPATCPNLAAVANGKNMPALRSVILCTEDSILPGQVDTALENLRRCLPQLGANAPLVFVRPRNTAVLANILTMEGVGHITGFVVPKATRESLVAHVALIPKRFLLMPILETREVFDPAEVAGIRQALLTPGVRERVLALRIGGNDLMNLLGIRRRPGRTIYDGAIGPVIASLATAFTPDGFSLTAPVFEEFGDLETLDEEVFRDLEHGLVGKTAIHPSQVSRIEKHYRVSSMDLAMASRVLEPGAPAVFPVEQVMCEPATHTAWARSVVARASIYGVMEGVERAGDLPGRNQS